jgi:hypothetical protein
MTPLQKSQRAFFDALTDARDRLDDQGYRALLAILEARLAKELGRLTLGEALHARRDRP